MSALERVGIASVSHASSNSASVRQEQTSEAFSFKWAQRDTYESPAVQLQARRWLIERYCAGDVSWLDRTLAGERKIILDAGCGSGYSALALFGDLLREHDYLGIDISTAVEVAKQRFSERALPGDFLQCDLMKSGIPADSIDIVFSEGVLHHTDSTEAAIHEMSRLLKPGGLFLFYVYAKKGAVREFTDDFIREHLRGMDDKSAWDALLPLTRLGIALGSANCKILVQEPVDFLGIPAGEVDVQRLFYWAICKTFYRPEYSEQEMHHINFDWFRPLNCHRHTGDEIREICLRAGLKIERHCEQESGHTIVARKLNR